MPNYNGRVRVMVGAGDGAAYGQTEKCVMVRKPVMLLGTLPRIIGTSEEMEIPATVFATEPKVGKVTVSISCSDNMEIVGPKSRDINFTDVGDIQSIFRIRVKNRPGAGKVTLTATGKGEKTIYETDIEIRSVRRPQTKVTPATLEPGKSWKETINMPGEEGTNSLILEVSDVPPLNLGERLNYLIGYPHGCIEQITSKGFPQLYLKQVATLTAEQERVTEGAVKEVIRRMRSYQMPSGAFSYWPGGSTSYGWATTYATHFLLEAEAKGFLVPDNMKKAALNDLKRSARNWKSIKNNESRSEEMTQAYRLYLLALARQPEVGAMNRMKEQTHIAPVAQWLLAGAYALIGREDVGNSLVSQTTPVDNGYDVYDRTFGSNLRDKAIQLQTLVLLKKTREASEVVKELSQKLSAGDWYSTQTTAYCLLAVTSYMNRHSVDESMQFSYNVDGKKDKINSTKSIWSAPLIQYGKSNIPVEVKNEGKGILFVQVITEGVPVQGTEEDYSNDVKIETWFTDIQNKELDVKELESGTNFTAMVTVKNPTTQSLKHLVLTQIFPAGWEILNTRFLNEEDNSGNPSGVNYQDFRDDRVYSYIDLLGPGKEVTIKINLCAVYSGTFYLPPVWCEAMYDHLVRANTEGSQVVVK
ncbi:MAG: hypothetical protein LUG98_08630, partial [Tannerellaceae bacterium]|nr:hypothetical protein [Tannerellaceae bacterium]